MPWSSKRVSGSHHIARETPDNGASNTGGSSAAGCKSPPPPYHSSNKARGRTFGGITKASSRASTIKKNIQRLSSTLEDPFILDTGPGSTSIGTSSQITLPSHPPSSTMGSNTTDETMTSATLVPTMSEPPPSNQLALEHHGFSTCFLCG
ncbi:hypothetical protein K439DRAFT_1621323 [Ramaria rubella]|nr:hypothetical protein K439DRAFT_1621323 [Ramaria rubella]